MQTELSVNQTVADFEIRVGMVRIVDSSCKKPLVICNNIFSIFLNQIKAQRDQKSIV
jgi:hypothetical protein